MKNILLAGLAVLLLSGCASFQGGDADNAGSSSGTIREQGTTGLGVGSDTTTQTGIDTGTRSGSGIRPR